MPANPVWQQTRSTSATLHPSTASQNPQGKLMFKSRRNLTYPKRQNREQIFHFWVSLFFFSFCNYLPHKQKLTKNLTKKIGYQVLSAALKKSQTTYTGHCLLFIEPRTPDNKTPGNSSTRRPRPRRRPLIFFDKITTVSMHDHSLFVRAANNLL